jgi:ribosome-binding factor A
MAVVSIAALISAPLSFAADDKIGIFETIFESSQSFDETTAALDAALKASSLQLHGTHDVRVPDDKHQARVYVLTSPAYVAAAADEPARTISAQILRIAVYTQGDAQTTYVNMANPVAHAMVFYADSNNYDAMMAAARSVAGEIRDVVAALPGKAMSRQQEPLRREKHYRKFKGDGPARMMAKFRTFEKSQLEIEVGPQQDFDATIAAVVAAVTTSTVSDADDSTGWEIIAEVRLRDDAAYLGLTNPYIEDKMVRINSRFRGDSKSDRSPYPGVDHVAALPTEVLIVQVGGKTRVLHYGQMWRMQLYFWDSGYRAFTANVGVPSAIANSIEDVIEGAN